MDNQAICASLELSDPGLSTGFCITNSGGTPVPGDQLFNLCHLLHRRDTVDQAADRTDCL